MLAIEVFDHVLKIKQREAYEKSWLLRIAVQPNCDAKGQKEGFAAAQEIGNVGKRAVRKSAFDVVDHDARVRMIGFDWQSGGEAWARRYPQKVEWLKSQGITLDEAAAAADVWWKSRVGEAAEEIGDAAAGPEDRPGEGVAGAESLANEPLVDSSF